MLFQLINADIGYADRVVLANLNLSIKEGEKVALLGPSGSGKSTLLAHLHAQRPNDIALCPQLHAMVEVLSAYQNIYMGGLDRRPTLANLWNLIRPLAKSKQEILILSQSLDIEDCLWSSVDRLSGGQRQRVALGRALYRQKDIFLGDEPVSALDPRQAEQLMSQVLQSHTTAVVCLHQPNLALSLFDRVIALKNGGILLDAPSERLELADIHTAYQNSDSLKWEDPYLRTADSDQASLSQSACTSPAPPVD